MSRRWPLALPAALACAGIALAASKPAQAAAGPDSPQQLVERLEAAWSARDVEAYLALWEFATVDAYADERRYAELAFAADSSELRLEPPDPAAAARDGVAVGVDVFVIGEPRGRVDQWLFSMVRRAAGWRIVVKQPVGQIEGLIHLSLDPQGYRADGLRLQLEDFELEMQRGSLFLSPANLGPTLLVFVGEAEARFHPRPEEEREQLRQFSGRPELTERVKAALVRIHPADLYKVLDPVRLDPDPDAARRLATADRLFREQGSKAFVLDTAAPRSPWWLLPSVGDAAVVFETRRGTLTFTVSSSEPEGLSLFLRDKRRQICLYPREGGTTRYSEDELRSADILSHDLRLRVEPGSQALVGEDTLRIEMLAASSTLRLKLDDALQVESVTSRAGRHLFFRVRNQGTLMISLGSLSGTLGEIQLTVRYSGVLPPSPIESEQLQGVREPQDSVALSQDDVPIEAVLVYTNRSAWYPQGLTDDYATARLRFDVPAGYTAVSGGVRREARIVGDRTLVEYAQEQPGRYITAAIGRLYEMGTSTESGIPIHTFAVARLRGEAEQTARQAGEMLRFYTEQFGPYPYPTLNLALIEGYAPGGHSPPGMVLLQRRPVLLRRVLRDDPANFSDIPGFFLAHELAHQWWGHGLAGQNYRERWISEGVAQYAAALWVRHARGADDFRDVLRHYARWSFRHTELGPIHLGYRLGHIKSDPQIFRSIVYDKAACVLVMLRAIVGDDVFKDALIALQRERRFSKIGSDDLREALEKASGRDLEPYFATWIGGTRLPRLTVSKRATASGVRVEVAAEDLPGPVPLTITLTSRAGRREERVWLDPAGGVFSFETDRDTRVEVNDDRLLLAKIDER